MNYVSCSPYRVPVARLSAGQARVKVRMAKIEEEEKRAAAAVQQKQQTNLVEETPANIVVQ